MKLALSLFLLLASMLPAQCIRGRHPPGVLPGPAYAGCNEITSGPAPWFSLSAQPQLGQLFSWSWLDLPNRSPVCATAQAYVIINPTPIPPVTILGSPTCRALVPIGLVFYPLVPLCSGCFSSPAAVVPRAAALIGTTFYAQTHVVDVGPTGYKIASSNVLLTTILP